MESSRDILVVEDEAVVVASIRRSLRPRDLSVDLAADVAAALAFLEASAFKVVLCDLVLPGSSGFRVLEVIQREHPRTQAVVITGYATREHAIQSFRLGAFDFLPKPFDIDEQLAVVTRALRFYALESGKEADPRAADCHHLGRHTWALVDRDGSATLGVAETFRGTVGEVEKVRLPALEQHTVQGETCVRIEGRDRLVHQVRAPLSGRVIAVNQALESAADMVDRDPHGRGWLVRIVPRDAEKELPNLTRREPIRR